MNLNYPRWPDSTCVCRCFRERVTGEGGTYISTYDSLFLLLLELRNNDEIISLKCLKSIWVIGSTECDEGGGGDWGGGGKGLLLNFRAGNFSLHSCPFEGRDTLTLV